MINVFQPQLGTEELTALAAVFARSWPGRGPESEAFEQEFAAHLGVPPGQVMFVNSGTSGLFLAVELLEVGPGDEVVLPTISFVAAGNAIAAAGARPVFCDVDPHTLNPTADQVAACLTARTRAVLVLHYGGYPGEIAAIARLCRDRGVPLIEDSTCAPASQVDGRACGTFGDLAVWSFDAVKVLVTGDGGMLHLRDPALVPPARRLAHHGFDPGQDLGPPPVRLDQPAPAHHGRHRVGDELAAAIGQVQLRRLPELVARRAEVVAGYDRLLAGVDGLRLPPPLPAGHRSSYYFYWVQLDPAIRSEVATELYRAGVYTNFHYPPLHRVPIYRSGQTLPRAEWAAARTLCLPLHPGLTGADVATVAGGLRAAVTGRRVAAG